jgi:hypothetical protein
VLGVTLVFGSLGGMKFWGRVAERAYEKPTFLAGMACFLVFASPPMLLKAHGIFPAAESRIYVPTLVAVSFL